MDYVRELGDWMGQNETINTPIRHKMYRILNRTIPWASQYAIRMKVYAMICEADAYKYKQNYKNAQSLYQQSIAVIQSMFDSNSQNSIKQNTVSKSRLKTRQREQNEREISNQSYQNNNITLKCEDFVSWLNISCRLKRKLAQVYIKQNDIHNAISLCQQVLLCVCEIFVCAFLVCVCVFWFVTSKWWLRSYSQ